jgi:hypothetical protein
MRRVVLKKKKKKKKKKKEKRLKNIVASFETMDGGDVSQSSYSAS